MIRKHNGRLGYIESETGIANYDNSILPEQPFKLISNPDFKLPKPSIWSRIITVFKEKMLYMYQLLKRKR